MRLLWAGQHGLRRLRRPTLPGEHGDLRSRRPRRRLRSDDVRRARPRRGRRLRRSLLQRHRHGPTLRHRLQRHRDQHQPDDLGGLRHLRQRLRRRDRRGRHRSLLGRRRRRHLRHDGRRDHDGLRLPRRLDRPRARRRPRRLRRGQRGPLPGGRGVLRSLRLGLQRGGVDETEDFDDDGFAPVDATCEVVEGEGHRPKTDCYDFNADAYPGQESFFGRERGDGSFDYNCDDRPERRWGIIELSDLDDCVIPEGGGIPPRPPRCRSRDFDPPLFVNTASVACGDSEYLARGCGGSLVGTPPCARGDNTRQECR